MIVTAVERAAKRRGHVEIFVDGIAALDLPRTAAAKHELRPGRVIDQQEIETIAAAEQRRQAMQIAVAMLARRPHSEREVRRRLGRAKLEPSAIDETISKLLSANLLDDAAFARAFTESRDRFSPRGHRLLTQELRALGVDIETASEAAAEVSEEDAAYRAASKRMKSLERLDYAAFRTRLAGQLQRRGFNWEITRATVDRCWHELGRPDQSSDEAFAG